MWMDTRPVKKQPQIPRIRMGSRVQAVKGMDTQKATKTRKTSPP